MEYVWYASYGSNILEERFNCYIEGSKYKHNSKSEYGCINKSLPIDSRSYIFNIGLSFAFNSYKWNGGGVAFLDKNLSNKKTFAKIYKITKEQFTHIFMQENGLNPHKDELMVDFTSLSKDKSLIVSDSWYGLILEVDEIDGLPVYTFTNPNVLNEYNCPSPEYLQTIISGIKSSRDIPNKQIIDAFKEYNGIKDNDECIDLESFINSL